jgi:endonuclease-3
VTEIIRLLTKEYPGAATALKYSSPLELLIATILSAQSTDQKVNEITPILFARYKTAQDYARAPLKELESHLKTLGLHKSKSRYIKGSCEIIVERFDSEVPRTMDEILTLPGVARKTANIVLAKAFGVIEGIAVDTHVKRLAQRLHLSREENPDKIERNLVKIVPRGEWAHITDLLIAHGRLICVARKPKCAMCAINHLCPSAFTFDP